MNRHCNTCEKEKSVTEFGKRAASKDGLAAKCKNCQSAYDKIRSNDPQRYLARYEYTKTPKGKLAAAKANKKYRETYPNKYKAHNIVNNAIRSGKLARESCEVCGRVTDVHAHHDDYLKPLNIRWLCSKHHAKWHSENGEARNAT